MALKVPDIDETQAPLLDHLIELRGRLVRCVIALSLAFAVCLYFADSILGFLVRPLTDAFPPGAGQLIFTQLYEVFFVELKVALFAGFFVSFPIIANQLWAFVAPGLYAKEKKAFLPFLIATPVLFTAGAALAYFVVMPTAFKFFLGYEGTAGGLKIEALPSAGEYLSLVMQFILAFGISFLLPVLLLLLNRAGIVPAIVRRPPLCCGADRGLGCNRDPARPRFTIDPGDTSAVAVRRSAGNHVAGRTPRRENRQRSSRRTHRELVRVASIVTPIPVGASMHSGTICGLQAKKTGP